MAALQDVLHVQHVFQPLYIFWNNNTFLISEILVPAKNFETHKLHKTTKPAFTLTEIMQQMSQEHTEFHEIPFSCHSTLIQLWTAMADKKINITERNAWQRHNPPTHSVNPHEDKTLTPRAEHLAANERHERKRKCCVHPWTRTANSYQITSKDFPWNVEG